MNRKAALVAVGAPLALYGGWTLATWLLEGRMQTFLRPEAALDRAAYAVTVNICIGTALAVGTLGLLVRQGQVSLDGAGFGQVAASPLKTGIALVLGAGLYVAQGAPSLDPVVLLNAFAQVLVTTVAEVIVCWAVVGSAAEALLEPRGRILALVGASVTASVLFGLYHFAHSAPFNTVPLVVILSLVGLATSAFFFVTRDIYATVVFHNFLGIFGVVQALAKADKLSSFQTPQMPLLGLALVSIGVLAAAHWLLRRSVSSGVNRSPELKALEAGQHSLSSR